MRLRISIVSILLLFSFLIKADDKVTVVNTAFSTGKYYDIQLPVMMDSTNMKGQRFGNLDLLHSFISFPKISDFTDPLKANIYDSFQFPRPQSNARFYLFSFDISVDKFTKSILKVKAPSMFEVYINDVKEIEKTTIEDTLSASKTANMTFAMLPSAKYNVLVKYMSLSTNKAPEEVKVTIEPKDMTSDVSYKVNEKNKRNITIRDVLVGKRVTSATISPSGDYVLLEYTITENDGKFYKEKELLTLKTGKRVILSSYINYAWMPISNKLYYIKRTSETSSLIAVDPETLSEIVVASNIPEGICRLTPDERTLIYTDNEKGEATKSDLILVTSPESVQPGDADRKFISRYNLASGIKERLTFGKNSTAIEDISVDSRYLLFSVSEYEPTERPFFFNSFYRIDLQTLSVDTLFEKQGFAKSAIFSPDGKKILVEGSAEAFGGIGNILPKDEIPNSYNKLAYVMDIATKKVDAITRDFAPSINNSFWNKEDGMIYFLATDKDYVKVFQYNPINRKFRQLTLSEDVVKEFDMAHHATKAVYFGQGIFNSTKAYVYDLKTDRSSLIADPQQPVIDDLSLSKVEDWNFTSSNGATIYGRYYLPPNFDPSKKYPLIVYYYGGTVPTLRTLESPYPSQVYASLGYVVYVLQPSGSVGFGQQFAAEHVNGWGKQNAQDIIDGTKLFVKQHPFVNDKKIGCIGASYGGYMTMYLQTQTDIFTAAVSHAGISSIASYWGEGYWGYTYSSGASADSYPWNNAELYVKQSPLFNADKVNTPMLLLHGTVDTNVPIGESMQMYTALRILGKPVEFIQIKGENHSVQNFDKKIEWNNSIYAWFAKWLQDDSSWWDNLYPASKK